MRWSGSTSSAAGRSRPGRVSTGCRSSATSAGRKGGPMLTRRELLALGGAAGATALLGAPAARAQKKGGDVIVGTISAPPLTDAQASTAEVSRNISLHWIETLWARDENGNSMPDLAAKTETSPDGRVYTFTLRQGVMFHNGQEMTAQDV